jgi:epoxyqueuosine reductase
MMESNHTTDWNQLALTIKSIGRDLGFQQLGITDTDLGNAETYLLQWLDEGQHGDMQWMARHGTKRTRPADLVPDTVRIISARMDYLPANATEMQSVLDDATMAYVSRYALGRDYHKLMRQRLQKLATEIRGLIGEFGYRVFVDSAPVMEKPLAEKAGLGWIGKHTNLLNQQAGSWFFLGEIYTDMPLPPDKPAQAHCGDCHACIDACPTGAITAPYQLDARLCISYLTIEHQGIIPEALRPLIGNRIYGCDDCQICCPWNRFAQLSAEHDFRPRHRLDNIGLIEVFEWDENTFLNKTEGSAIRRIGHERWLRNIAVALGNRVSDPQPIIEVLKTRYPQVTDLVRVHIDWAIKRLSAPSS